MNRGWHFVPGSGVFHLWSWFVVVICPFTLDREFLGRESFSCCCCWWWWSSCGSVLVVPFAAMKWCAITSHNDFFFCLILVIFYVDICLIDLPKITFTIITARISPESYLISVSGHSRRQNLSPKKRGHVATCSFPWRSPRWEIPLSCIAVFGISCSTELAARNAGLVDDHRELDHGSFFRRPRVCQVGL